MNNTDAEIMYVYTDGSCIHNGYPNAKAGYGVYFGKDDLRNISKRVPEDMLQTNNVGELMAIIEAAKIISKDVKAIIYTDSEYCITMAQKTTYTNKTKNIELVKEMGDLLRAKNIELRHIRSHTNLNDKHSLGNEQADLLANMSIGLYNKNSEENKKIYLNVKYAEKDDAKKLGARWDPTKKKWYGYNNNTELLAKYS